MRRTLLLIPHEVASIPVFGFGWLLGIMVLASIGLTISLYFSKHSITDYWRTNGVLWASAAALIAFVMPLVEIESVTGEPVGMAVRGWGVMLLIGFTASAALAIARGQRYGIGEDVMLGIAPWLLLGGLVGARLFYVIEYRDQFFTGDMRSTVGNLLNFTAGGMVVYGAFIGGFLAGTIYVLRNRLSFLTMGDVIVPSLFIGLCLGRLGCLMNGCCYGNACEPDWASLRFPNGSPVYQDQLASGELIGFRLNESQSRVEVVATDSLAARDGVKVGDAVTELRTVRSVEEANPGQPAEDVPLGLIAVIGGKEHYWPASQLPARANPVRATQIISSLGGLILCLLLCLFSRYVYRPGIVMLVGFASYAVLRFVMEMLRNDEPGQFGTTLTISQWVSIVVFLLSCAGLVWLRLWERSYEQDDHPEARIPGSVGG